MSAESTTPRADELLAEAGWIRALAGRLVADAATADDVAQETLIVALRRPPERERPLRPWLARVLRNVVYQRRRRERARAVREREAARAEALPPAGELVARADLQRVLVETVLATAEPYRSVLLLRYYEGLSTGDVARRLGRPAGTVRSQLTRAIESVQAALDRRHAGDRRAWVSMLVPLVSSDAGSVAGARRTELRIPRGANAPSVLVPATAFLFGAGAIGAAVWWLARDAGAPPSSAPPGAVASAPERAPPSPGARASVDVAVAPGGALDHASARSDSAAPVPAPPAAPIRGRVLERTTGEQLERYALELRFADGGRELVLTGARGAFESERALAAGTIEIALLDHPDADPVRVVPYAHAPDAAAELTVRVGPTYELALALSGGIAAGDLVACLAGRSHEQNLHGTMERYPAPAHVRADGPQPWVRFPARSMLTVGAGDPWELTVASRDGLWFARAQVAGVTGRAPEPVELRLERRGAVAGRIATRAGPLPFRTVVHLTWPAGERRGDALRDSLLTVADEQGRFRFRALPDGQYRLYTYAPGFAKAELGVRAVAGETATPLVELEGLPGAGAIGGTLTSASGTFERTQRVWLFHESDGLARFRCDVAWSGPDGARVGRFRAEDVAEGTYRVRVLPDELLPWEPADLRARPGDEDLRLFLDDAVPLTDIELRARDARTRKPIPFADFTWWTPALRPLLAHDRPHGDVVAERVPLDAAFFWTARAEGYAPVWGDRSALPAVDGRAGLELALEPGWGAHVVVLDEQTGAPVAGVEVLLDGASMGATSALGVLPVELARRPARLEVRRDGWTMVDSFAVHAATGRFDDLEWASLRVHVRKTE